MDDSNSFNHTTYLLNERHWSAKPLAQQCMWLYLLPRAFCFVPAYMYSLLKGFRLSHACFVHSVLFLLALYARPIPEIFGERVQLCTSYTWLLCGEITKLDIRLAMCLRDDGLPETQGMTRQGLRYNHRLFHRQCDRSCKEAAESRSRWTFQIPWVATGINWAIPLNRRVHPPRKSNFQLPPRTAND